MTLKMMGGKIAPSPSLSANRSSIQRSAATSARRRSGNSRIASQALIALSTPRKNRSHVNSPRCGPAPGERSFGHFSGGSMNSSPMPREGSTSRRGWCAHITESGTKIVKLGDTVLTVTDQKVDLLSFDTVNNTAGVSSVSVFTLKDGSPAVIETNREKFGASRYFVQDGKTYTILHVPMDAAGKLEQGVTPASKPTETQPQAAL